MPTTILQSAVGTGKTEAALQRLLDVICRDPDPFARAWVLLASRRQEFAFRQRLAENNTERAVYFNAEFFNFYELYARLLHMAGVPFRRIADSARLGLLRHIIEQMQASHQLETFASIAETPGFVRVVADLLDELKQNRVRPAAYQAAAQTRKDHELAQIYTRYQQMLRDNQLVDGEGQGWLALETLTNPDTSFSPDVMLLLVDGYDQFTPVQAELLAALSEHVGDVVLTLTTVPEREGNPGRRFEQTLKRLETAHQQMNAPYEVQRLTEPTVARQPDLQTLGENLLRGRAPVPLQNPHSMRLVEAPDERTEVAALLRDVKTQLLNGTRPDDILIAVRDWSRYQTYFEMYRQLYELPLLLHKGDPIAENPAVTELLNVLQLSGRNLDALTSFRRRQLLDVLRSPYIEAAELDAAQVDLLERISREKQVIGGRQNWLNAIESAAIPFYDHEAGKEHDPLITTKQAGTLRDALEDFFKAVSPYTDERTVSEHIAWLDELIGSDTLDDPDDEPFLPGEIHPGRETSKHYSLNIPACIRAIDDTPQTEQILNRDIVALEHVKKLMHGMLETQVFLRDTLNETPGAVAWERFFAELTSSIESITPMQRTPQRSGRVLVTGVADARGLPHERVYIPGLSESIFPAEQPEDPLYLDSERERLSDDGVLLESVSERADDSGLFYELISLPRERLVLSRPTVREGKPWVESHLWRITRAVFAGLPVDTYKIGDVVPVDEVAALDEVLLSVADGLTNNREQAVMSLYQWLHTDNQRLARWQHLRQGRTGEMKRLSQSAHDAYSGYLEKAQSVQKAAAYLDASHRWSASQLNDFGACGYRFFAKRLLKLEALDEPEEGLDVLQLGSLNHAILQEAYEEIEARELAITPKNQQVALDILNEFAARVLYNAEEIYGFRASALWEQEQVVLLRRLRNLVALDFSDESPLNKFGTERKPYRLEWAFGFTGEPQIRIPLADGESIQVVGSIDRVDLVDDRLIVLDYKTGSTKIQTREMAEGRNFQMMVYLLALQQLIDYYDLPYRVGGGAFFHIRSQETSGLIEINADDVTQVDDITQAMQYATRYIRQGRSGDFSVQPSSPSDGRCVRYCDYYQLCRLTMTNQFKQGNNA